MLLSDWTTVVVVVVDVREKSKVLQFTRIYATREGHLRQALSIFRES